MDEARAVMNLKEAIIELQGPVDFVQHYLDTCQLAIKGLQNLPKDIAVSEQKAKSSPRKRKGVPRSKAGETKRATGAGAIRGYLQEGFFDEPRSTREVKQRLNDAGLTRTSNAIRMTLEKLSVAKLLDRLTKGRSVRFQRAVQS